MKFIHDRPVLTITLCALAIHGLLLYAYGPIESPDSKRYIGSAEKIIESNFSLRTLFGDSEARVPASYFNFTFIVALAKLIFGSWWKLAVAWANLAFTAGAGALVLTMLRRATGNNLVVLGAGVFFIFSADAFIWAKFILTDSSFLFTVILFLYAAFSIFPPDGESPHSTLGWRLALPTVLVASLFHRPTGVVLIPLLAVVLVSYPFLSRVTPGGRRGWFRMYFALLGLVGITATAVVSYLMLLPDIGLQTDLLKLIEVPRQFYRTGIVIFARPHTFIEAEPGMGSYFYLTWVRFLYFFAIMLKGYSLKHTLFNMIFYIPLYTLAAVGVLQIFRANSGFSPRQKWLVFLCTNFIFFFAMFSAMTLIDYDHRYRLPCIPPLITLAGVGIHALLGSRRLTGRADKGLAKFGLSGRRNFQRENN